MLAAEELHRVLAYDPETGVFTWRLAIGRKTRVGAVAGSLSDKGYRRIMIAGRRYLEHRLAWWFYHGVSPPDQVDHINGIRHDNRILNLRLATNGENQMNTTAKKSNRLGYKGIYWVARDKMWVAEIQANKKRHRLGYFKSPEAAHAAYCNAAKILHGEFAPK